MCKLTPELEKKIKDSQMGTARRLLANMGMPHLEALLPEDVKELSAFIRGYVEYAAVLTESKMDDFEQIWARQAFIVEYLL